MTNIEHLTEKIENVLYYMNNIDEFGDDSWENLTKTKLHDKDETYIDDVDILIDEYIELGLSAFYVKYVDFMPDEVKRVDRKHTSKRIHIGFNFLERHENAERLARINSNHIIVDKKDWETVISFFHNNYDASKMLQKYINPVNENTTEDCTDN